MNTPASTHHSRTLSFRRDSTFVQCDDGQCTRPGRFTSRTERSYLTGKLALILTLHRHVNLTPADSAYSTILDRNSLLEVSNTLRFHQDYPDSFEWTYYRKCRAGGCWPVRAPLVSGQWCRRKQSAYCDPHGR